MMRKLQIGGVSPLYVCKGTHQKIFKRNIPEIVEKHNYGTHLKKVPPHITK